MSAFECIKRIWEPKSQRSSKIIWEYLDSLDRRFFSVKRADEEKGTNHCVYENRIAMTDSGKKAPISLRKLLEGTEPYPEKGIIMISAPSDGYAKDFFAIRLMILGYDALREKGGNLKDFVKMQEGLRVPIVVLEDAIKFYQEKNALDNLSRICTDSIRLWLERNEGNQWSAEEDPALNELMYRLLTAGQLLLLMPRESFENIPSLFPFVIHALYSGGRKNGNLIIYVGEDEDRFYEQQYCRLVQLGDLSKEEILEHIRFVSLNDEETVSFFQELLVENEFINNELKIPERLLFMTKFFMGESQINNDDKKTLKKLKNAAQLYEAVIDNSIRASVQKHLKKPVSQKTLKIVRDTLSRMAWGEITGKEETEDLIDKTNGLFRDSLKKSAREQLGAGFEIWSRLTDDSDFLVDGKNEFHFIGCKHYLAAEKLLYELQNQKGQREDILCTPAFLEKENYQIYLFLIDLIKDKVKEQETQKEYFDIIWKSITDDRMQGENNRVQVLISILERFGRMHDVNFINAFLNFVLKELSSKYYDSHVFDTIHMINEDYPDVGINDYLKKCYERLRKDTDKSKESVDNQKRRLSYFFGKEKCGIPTAVIEDLLDPTVHIHVKYHIILAVIENYDEPGTQKILKENYEKITACTEKADCILYSDYLMLMAKINNVERGHVEEELRLQSKLFLELKQGQYWKRAHAAGALGRQGLYASVEKLQEQLRNEMQQIETQRDSLKAVSYIVEAICELFYRQNKDITEKGEDATRRQQYCEGIRQCTESFLNMISLEANDEERAEDTDQERRAMMTYATIAEGIIYLAGPVESNPPEDIGRHIREGQKNLQENCRTVLKSFDIVKTNYGNSFGNVADKIENMQQLSNRLYYMTARKREKGNEQEKCPDCDAGSVIVNNKGPVTHQIIVADHGKAEIHL